MRGPALLILAFAVALCACGDDGDGSAARPETAAGTTATREDSPFAGDACKLLTAAEVRQVLGTAAKGKLVAPANESSGQPGQCRWNSGKSANLADPGSRPNVIQVNLGGRDWFDNSRTLAERTGKGYAEVDGVGDSAYFGGGGGGVLVGAAGITVVAGGLAVGDANTRKVVVGMLEKVAANY